MRTVLTALTALMLFATPVVAGDWEDALQGGILSCAFKR